jgi:hypothetical protein
MCTGGKGRRRISDHVIIDSDADGDNSTMTPTQSNATGDLLGPEDDDDDLPARVTVEAASAHFGSKRKSVELEAGMPPRTLLLGV